MSNNSSYSESSFHDQDGEVSHEDMSHEDKVNGRKRLLSEVRVVRKKGTRPLAHFLQGLVRLLGEEGDRYRHLIFWSDNGLSFVITNSEQLVREGVLDKFFKMTKYSSLVRQLNMYGCVKHSSRMGPTVYTQPFLQRDRPDLLSKIVRRVPGAAGEVAPPKPLENPSALLTERELGEALSRNPDAKAVATAMLGRKRTTNRLLEPSRSRVRREALAAEKPRHNPPRRAAEGVAKALRLARTTESGDEDGVDGVDGVDGMDGMEEEERGGVMVVNEEEGGQAEEEEEEEEEMYKRYAEHKNAANAVSPAKRPRLAEEIRAHLSVNPATNRTRHSTRPLRASAARAAASSWSPLMQHQHQHQHYNNPQEPALPSEQPPSSQRTAAPRVFLPAAPHTPVLSSAGQQSSSSATATATATATLAAGKPVGPTMLFGGAAAATAAAAAASALRSNRPAPSSSSATAVVPDPSGEAVRARAAIPSSFLSQLNLLSQKDVSSIFSPSLTAKAALIAESKADFLSPLLGADDLEHEIEAFGEQETPRLGCHL